MRRTDQDSPRTAHMGSPPRASICGANGFCGDHGVLSVETGFSITNIINDNWRNCDFSRQEAGVLEQSLLTGKSP
jgi:hypothetical protein